MIPSLLIIDDHVSVRETLQFLLLRRGYAVHVAAGGAEALALVQQQPIDGALVDVQMPGMNGFDVCRALREHAAVHGRPISVWMMSGGRTAELAKRAAEAGALAMLGKPFDFGELSRRFDEQFGPVQAVAERAAS